MRGRTALVAVGVAATMAATLPAVPASATYAGRNGLIVFKRGSDLYTVTATGGSLRRLTYNGGSQPRWRRDGQRIVFVRSGAVWTMRADGSDQRKIVSSGKQPTWSPSGRVVYVGTQYIANADGECTVSRIFSVTESGTDRTGLTPLGDCGSEGSGLPPEYTHPGYGPTGDLLYEVHHPRRRSDSWQITSTSYGKSWDLWCDYLMCNASFQGTWFQPNYQPTGRNYLMVTDANFTGETDGRRRLYLKDAQSTWKRRIGTDLDAADPTSSPDGKHALYARLTPGTTPVIRQYTFATNTTKTLITNGVQPDWQPLP